jgi:hypothetical protein
LLFHRTFLWRYKGIRVLSWRRPKLLLLTGEFKKIWKKGHDLSLPPSFPSKIKPEIESDEDHGPYHDERPGKFEINDLLDVVDDEGSRVHPFDRSQTSR